MLRKQSIKKDRILKFAAGFVYFSVLCVPLLTSRPVLLHVLDCYGNKEENEGKYMHHFTSECMYKRLRNHSSDFGTTLSKFLWFHCFFTLSDTGVQVKMALLCWLPP